MREKAEGTWELPGFLVTEVGELVPGTRSGTDARGQGLQGRSHTLGPGHRECDMSTGWQAELPIGIGLQTWNCS